MTLIQLEVDRTGFSNLLLGWYDINKRTLPWRSDKPDPYAVWVSEIMLQQTTVTAVIGYYQRWMSRFPTVQTLADAQLDDVLQHWAGLGYYSRARNLHKGARVVVEQYDGRVPDSIAELIKLPGVGRYTAGAIASIAYGQCEAVVDANVRRVLSRVAGLKADSDSKSLDSRVWSVAESLLPTERVGAYNQALMDLGSSVCTPKAPLCLTCPVSGSCEAFRLGDPESYPEPAKAKTWNEMRHVSLAVVNEGRVLVGQLRDDSAWWPGLWELPRAVVPVGVDEAEAAGCIASKLGLEAGLEFTMFTFLKHVVTNNKIKLTCYTVNCYNASSRDLPDYSTLKWVDGDEAVRLAFSAPQKRLITKLVEAGLI